MRFPSEEGVHNPGSGFFFLQFLFHGWISRCLHPGYLLLFPFLLCGMKTARNPAVEQKLQKKESRSRIMHTFFRRKSHPSPPTQYITMRTPISPSPREAVTVVPIHTLYMNSSVPFWKNANLPLMTSWALTGQAPESVHTNPL